MDKKEILYLIWQYIGGCIVMPLIYWYFEGRFL